MIENFAGNISRLRKEQGLSQGELAELVGVNKQTISNIERGIRYPKFETLEKFAQVFKASPVQLFGTDKEIEISTTESVMDRIDEYEDRVQSMMKFAKVFDHYYLEKIDDVFEKVSYIDSKFSATPSINRDGDYDFDENGKVKMNKPFIPSIENSVDKLYDEVSSIERLFSRPIVYQDGNPMIKNDNSPIRQKAIIDDYSKQLDEIVDKIEYIKQNEKFLSSDLPKRDNQSNKE